MKMIIFPLLVINVEQEYFSFGDKDKITLDTCLNLHIESDGSITILDFGNRNKYHSEISCVELFWNKGYVPPNINRFDLLTSWFEYGFNSWTSQYHSVFSIVVKFKNYSILRSSLLGFEKVILEQVALRSGVKKVLFE